MDKKTVAIIFGGNSSEYSVSLISASAVIRNLNKEKYEIITIGITQKGEWYRYFGNVEDIEKDNWCTEDKCTKAYIVPSKDIKGIIELNSDGVNITPVDVVFPVLHGKNGEDGTLQGLLELSGLPFVGCNTLSSALCMEKDIAHKLAKLAGVKVPESIKINRNMNIETISKMITTLKYPLFVKPIKAGSSYGITKIFKNDDLRSAIDEAFKYDEDVIIEESIDGFEVGCGILGNDELMLGEVDEIELSSGFFDFTEKYTLKTSSIHMPARISKETSDRLKQTAKVLYKVLCCTGFARVDMFLTPEEEIYFNEINTIPGFTEHSRYPNMFKGIGVSYEEILDRLIELALNDR